MMMMMMMMVMMLMMLMVMMVMVMMMMMPLMLMTMSMHSSPPLHFAAQQPTSQPPTADAPAHTLHDTPNLSRQKTHAASVPPPPPMTLPAQRPPSPATSPANHSLR